MAVPALENSDLRIRLDTPSSPGPPNKTTEQVTRGADAISLPGVGWQARSPVL